ncbi:hypothetical protein RMHFA_05676 [Roseomonas mucosa]|nr:hypothetical protein RMHFA_05676 [Roseomonas mucosa]
MIGWRTAGKPAVLDSGAPFSLPSPVPAADPRPEPLPRRPISPKEIGRTKG